MNKLESVKCVTVMRTIHAYFKPQELCIIIHHVCRLVHTILLIFNKAGNYDTDVSSFFV